MRPEIRQITRIQKLLLFIIFIIIKISVSYFLIVAIYLSGIRISNIRKWLCLIVLVNNNNINNRTSTNPFYNDANEFNRILNEDEYEFTQKLDQQSPKESSRNSKNLENKSIDLIKVSIINKRPISPDIMDDCNLDETFDENFLDKSLPCQEDLNSLNI